MEGTLIIINELTTNVIYSVQYTTCLFQPTVWFKVWTLSSPSVTAFGPRQEHSLSWGR